MNNRITNILILIIILLILHFVVGRKKINQFKRKENKINQEAVKMENLNVGAIIKTSKGDIHIKFFPEVAPMTVTNMIALAKVGYYDGIKFHRVIPDFMIQGGDPTGTGAGGPGYNFKDEFKEGVVFDKPGILAMANAGPGTNGSQFFITHVETSWLNYKHTIFGEVVSEEDQKIVNSIKQGDIINTIEITGNVDEILKVNADLIAEIQQIVKK